MKTFFSDKKVPAVPPLLINGAFVIDFQEKANIFNSFSAQQLQCLVFCELTYMTEERIHSVTFIESNVFKIIRAMNVNKAHGYNNISVRMIKLCANSVVHPLTFKSIWRLIHLLPNGKEQAICAGVPQGSILGPKFPLYTLKT